MRKQDENPGKRFFRSTDRFVRQNGEWYFTTREGQMGPFPDELSARRNLQQYIGATNELDMFQQKREAARVKREQRMQPRKVSLDGLFALDSLIE